MVWDTFVIWNTLLSIVLIMLFHNLNWRAGRCQYEWIILSRVSTRSLFVGWQCFLFIIAFIIAICCFPSNQCSTIDCFVHPGTLSYSASPLVEGLHLTFSNCRFKQQYHAEYSFFMWQIWGLIRRRKNSCNWPCCRATILPRIATMYGPCQGYLVPSTMWSGQLTRL